MFESRYTNIMNALDTDGELRIERRGHTYYVLGRGHFIPADSYAEAMSILQQIKYGG